MKRVYKLLLIVLFVSLWSCQERSGQRTSCTATKIQKEQDDFSFAIWDSGGKDRSDQEWKEYFKKYTDAGITDFYLGAGPELLTRLVGITKEQNIRIHGWVWTLNRPGDTIAAKNKDWYAVNRKGENSYDYRAYVDYYQWLSPFSPGARQHIKNNITAVAQVKGLASVHLDYVRYCDVILGAQLQPKYQIVQNHEFPEYDYGYHPEARKGFKALFGKDPMEMRSPELSNEWRQYRMDAVTSLVNELTEIVHQHGQKISAAVFPFPEMSRQMVRQDWSAWDIDIYCPMNYHSFYLEDLPWIGFSVEAGIKEIRGRGQSYISGLYVPELTPQELQEAIQISKDAGANGVSLFSGSSLSEQHLAVVKQVSRNYKNQ